MRVCVFGLWHLGSVTAACLVKAGHHVVGLDPDEITISNLNRTEPPIYEPGLNELIHAAIQNEHILFTTDVEDAVSAAELIWVTFDTPVNEADEADVNYVTDHVEGLFPFLQDQTVVLISSQLPVGTASALANAYVESGNPANVAFAVSPENLRLGKAIEVFTNPDRVVVGVSEEWARERIGELFAPITTNIEWMSVASAEMTKHALNAFLATSVTFANEIAALCEQVGADAKEVERGLKSERRIGPGAYLGPGAAFSGGTLARDVVFLGQLASRYGLDTELLASVPRSNNAHKMWAVRRLREIIGKLNGAHVALLGLTYKPGTDTLRRSLAVEMAQQLANDGAIVHAHDPAVKALPKELENTMSLHQSANDAVQNAKAVIIATQWPDYKTLNDSLFDGKIVLDANGFLRERLGKREHVQYYSVGQTTNS